MSGRPEIPEGEDVLMQGAFDPAVYRLEVRVSVIAFAIFAVVVLFFWTTLFALAVIGLGGAGIFLLALAEYRAARGRTWALTRRALYLSNREPLPLSEIGRIKGSAWNLRLRLRAGGRLVILGEAQAMALRQKLRDLKAEGKS